MECVLLNVGGRATGAVGRRARIASDGPAMVTRPSRWPGKLFRGERGKFIHRNVLFFAKTWEKSDQLLIHDCIFGNC